MRAVLLLGAIALASCRPASLTGPGTDEAFARELAGRVAGAPQACVSAAPNESLRVVDYATVAYGSGSTIYVNRLGRNCPALRPHNILIVETTGSQHCRGDHVRGVEPGATIPGPVCILQDWVPYRRQ